MDPRSLSRKVLLPPIVLWLGILACSRGDVPASTTLGDPVSRTFGTEGSPLLPTTIVTPFVRPTPTATPAAPTPIASPTLPPTPTLISSAPPENILYTAQAGDTLRALAVRFGVVPSDIRFTDGALPAEGGLIAQDQLLVIPRRLGLTGPAERLIPDSELVFSPSVTDFDIEVFVNSQGGFLGQYREYVSRRTRNGAEVVQLVARDNSVNPHILLAILEFHSGWVTDPRQPPAASLDYPLGHVDPSDRGLFHQLTWLANELGKGYYGWRAGTLVDLLLQDGSFVRLAPDLNAGTVALQYYFAQRAGGREWGEALGANGVIAAYKRLFGDPSSYAHPLYEPGLSQPPMILPFLEGRVWAFTGGPHGAWEREAAWAALDFAPSAMETGCAVSDDWLVASAPGLVVRSENGVVVLDLDGDGLEQTGWSLLYLHVAEEGRVTKGTPVEQGDLLGHPSCEGGVATGTHAHLARKYNGEWILADGPLPFELSGWIARAGTEPYQGELVKGDQVVLACPCATQATLISR
ncbi:MAG TPA: hypothetical protein VJ123_08820 [Anaerolineales bacterium]|nr:hypothetical protein [Anaerolineales bacterium]